MTRNNTIPSVRVVEKSHRFLMPRSLKIRTSFLSCVLTVCILPSLKLRTSFLSCVLTFCILPSRLKLRTSFLSCVLTFCILLRILKLRTSFLSCVLTFCILFRQCHVLWSVCINFSGFWYC